MGGFALTGQSCTATSRVIVEEGIADRFAAALAEAANALNVGDGLDEGVQMGPAVSEDQLETDLDYVRIGKEEGAELLAGGGRAGERGHFLRPTVFDGVEAHSRLAQEEIFGPVVGIIRARDLDDAIFKANAVGYGLAGERRDQRPAPRAARSSTASRPASSRSTSPPRAWPSRRRSAASSSRAPTPSRSRDRRRSTSTRAPRRSTSPTREGVASPGYAWRL